MNHARFLIISFFFDYAFAELTNILLSPSKTRNEYRLGDQVNVTCTLIGQDKLSVLIQNKNKLFAENGLCVHDQFKCQKITDGDRLSYVFMINSLTWDEGGEWVCIHGSKILSVSLNIKVVGKVQSLAAELQHVSDTRGSALVPELLYGKGLKSNPFDLTRGASVRLTCSTGCSVPASGHEWTYRNTSIDSRVIMGSNLTSKVCAIAPQVSGLLTSTSVTLDCKSPSMVGNNEVTCRLQGTMDLRSVFVLCPGGHRPWTLTSGEIIGISASVAVAVLMVVLCLVSARRVVSSYRYGHVRHGVRV